MAMDHEIEDRSYQNTNRRRKMKYKVNNLLKKSLFSRLYSLNDTDSEEYKNMFKRGIVGILDSGKNLQRKDKIEVLEFAVQAYNHGDPEIEESYARDEFEGLTQAIEVEGLQLWSTIDMWVFLCAMYRDLTSRDLDEDYREELDGYYYHLPGFHDTNFSNDIDCELFIVEYDLLEKSLIALGRDRAETEDD